jgi:hypothetical protein
MYTMISLGVPLELLLLLLLLLLLWWQVLAYLLACLLAYLLTYLPTAIEFSLGGSSPYTSTDNTNKNRYIIGKIYKHNTNNTKQ